jgi:hypothetical protein
MANKNNIVKQEIIDRIKSHKDILHKKYGVIRIGLFGSYARDTFDEESDIDIYVEFEKNSFDNIAKTWVYLEKILGRKVDLVYNHKRINPTLKRNIEKEVIYG